MRLRKTLISSPKTFLIKTMKNNESIWYAFERESLPAALQGVVDTRLNGPALTFGAPRPREGDIVVGFCERPNYQERLAPLLIVTNEVSTFDVFSWMATYAPNTFPLSQFARVISDVDWEFLTSLSDERSYKYMHEDRWASLILGELLAQGENDSELSGIPFSRANACFSSAIARASLIYPKNSRAFSTCLNRLRKIESDSSFVRRPVSVALLAKTWETLHTHEYRRSDSYNSTEGQVVEAIEILLANQSPTKASTDIHLANYVGLQSDSIEERVLAFNMLLKHVGAKDTDEISDPRVNAVVASAAFLVGRGTSHIFLLRRLTKVLPTAVLWFGVLAALTGHKYWDEHWLRAVKGIEKHLRIQFNWEEPSLSDLCWHEYAWLANVYSKGEYFEGLSKNLPNVMSIEIIPGSACQMRLASSVSKTGEAEKMPRVEVKTLRERELEVVVSQLVSLAAKAQDIMQPPKPKATEKQPTLFDGDPVLSSKAPRKRARGGAGFDG